MRVLFLLLLPMSASAEWVTSVSKAAGEAKGKRRPVLIWIVTKGEASTERLEKEVWSVEPGKTLLRGFTNLKLEQAAVADPKTWQAVPTWAKQAEGASAAGDVRIIHPWGKERERFSFKDAKPPEVTQKIQEAFDGWEKAQAPIREDARALENAMKQHHSRFEDKDLMLSCVTRVIAHHEPWTLPLVTSTLYVSSIRMREKVIPELRRIEPEEGLWALLKWLDDEATQPGCDLGWKEVAAANDIRTVAKIKDGILNNQVCASTRVKALGQFREKSNIPFLIDLFSKVALPAPVPGQKEPPPSLHDDIAASLTRLTGQTFGKDVQKWKDWWKSSGGKFEFGK